MRMLILIPILALFSISTLAQELNITFTGTGESATVDSVIATNLITNESVIVPGSETLILSSATGIDDNLLTQQISIYPNPFDGITTLSLCTEQACKTTISIVNLAGQEIARKSDQLQIGNHSFTITLKEVGIYLINIVGDDTKSTKIICLSPSGANGIIYSGQNEIEKTIKTGHKSLYELAYTPGDWIHYRGFNANFISVVTDSASQSKFIDFEFIDCTDPDGRTYSTVKIGQQIWMEENLAYLPNVHSSDQGSKTQNFYYVYGYNGNLVSEAKQAENFDKFGVLYNWAASNKTCPQNWHLPSDDEWKVLEIELGMNTSELNLEIPRESGNVGHKLKSTNIWRKAYKGSNMSGFCGLPGGGRYSGNFSYKGSDGLFWTSTDQYTSHAIVRGLSLDKGVYRNGLHDKAQGFSVRCIKD